MPTSPPVLSATQRHNVLKRHHGPDHPLVLQARRALALAKTEDKIRRAIAAAPPLDGETLARLRALIPAATDDDRAA